MLGIPYLDGVVDVAGGVRLTSSDDGRQLLVGGDLPVETDGTRGNLDIALGLVAIKWNVAFHCDVGGITLQRRSNARPQDHRVAVGITLYLSALTHGFQFSHESYRGNAMRKVQTCRIPVRIVTLSQVSFGHFGKVDT
jgi:hypothetical protein